MGASKDSEAKTISTFTRDFLRKDVFPIDTLIEEILENLRLPVNEKSMVALCHKAKINPRVFERSLYYHDGFCKADLCRGCIIREYCGNESTKIFPNE